MPSGAHAGYHAPSVNPLAGIPVFDYARDITAAVFLFVSLGLPWDFAGQATDRWYVILATLISVGSLSLTYLRRLDVLPATWHDERSRMARLALNAPYALVAGIAIMVDLASLDASGEAGVASSGGMGGAITFGLAGAILAAAPRETEVDQSRYGAAEAQRWRTGVGVLGVVPAVLILVGLITALTEELFTFLPAALIMLLIVILVLPAVLLGVPAMGVARGDGAWRIVALGIGAVLAVLLIWSNSDSPLVESFGSLSMGLAFWLAPAAVAASAPVGRAMRPVAGHLLWINTAARLFTLLMVVLAMLLVLVSLILTEDVTERGEVVTVMIMLTIHLLGAAVARATLIRQPNIHGRNVVLALCAGFAVFGIVILAVASDTYNQAQHMDLFTVLAVIGFPALIAIILTVPKSVREHYQALSDRGHV